MRGTVLVLLLAQACATRAAPSSGEAAAQDNRPRKSDPAQPVLALELSELVFHPPDVLQGKVLLRNAGAVDALVWLGLEQGGRHFPSRLSLIARSEDRAGATFTLPVLDAPTSGAPLRLPLPSGAALEERIFFASETRLPAGRYQVLARFTGGPAPARGRDAVPVDSSPVPAVVP